MSFSKHFKFSQCLPSHCKNPAFVLYITPNESGVLHMGETVKTNVPFCYVKHTMALEEVGICTTIMTLQWTRFKQPLRWTLCHAWHASTKRRLSQQWLLFQVSSSTRENKIWMMIGRSRRRFTCRPSCVVYNAATHSMLTRWADAVLYHVSFWCVSPNVMDDIFL